MYDIFDHKEIKHKVMKRMTDYIIIIGFVIIPTKSKTLDVTATHFMKSLQTCS